MNPIDIILWALAAVVVVFAIVVIVAMLRGLFSKPRSTNQTTRIIDGRDAR